MILEKTYGCGIVTQSIISNKINIILHLFSGMSQRFLDEGASPKRARFHGSILDSNALHAGEGWKDLSETYIIFITENDIFNENKPIYHIDRMIKETKEEFGDGSHIIYVNGAYQGESPLGLLIHDFKCSEPEKMNYKVLADRVRYFKEDKEGMKSMSKLGDEWRREGREEGRREGRKEGRQEAKEDMAFQMLKDGEISKEKIAKYTGLSMESLNELALK